MATQDFSEKPSPESYFWRHIVLELLKYSMINKTFSCPNFDPVPIQVEFIVLHYTACNLKRTLQIFADPSRKVSSHLVVAEDGEVYELVRCWSGTVFRAWHAGPSQWADDGKVWCNFNDFSIGIELVNLNGNIFPFTQAQYESLTKIIQHLKSLYPNIELPARILGHEHIASIRGKADPGIKFDWDQFFKLNYPNQVVPLRTSTCPYELGIALEKFIEAVPEKKDAQTRFWESLSYLTETSVRLLQNAKENYFSQITKK